MSLETLAARPRRPAIALTAYRAAPDVAVAALYLALSSVFFRHSLDRLNSSIPGTADGILNAWWFGWTPHALGLGQSPLVTHAIAYPQGANEMWNTAVTPLATLFAPITLLAGPVAAVNLAFWLGPVVSALTAYAVLRRYVHRLPAMLGGALYAFSPFMYTESYGHLLLLWVFFPPLLLLLFDEIVVRQHRSPLLLGVVLAVVCAIQLLLSAELLAVGGILWAAAIVIAALLYPRQVRPRVGYLVKASATGFLLFAALAAYPGYVALHGPDRVVGLLQDPGRYVAPLWSFIVPTKMEYLTTASAVRFSRNFEGGNLSEAGSYLGIGLVAVVLACAVWRWREPLVRIVFCVFVVGAVLALGPWLDLTGTPNRSIKLPGVLFQHLPLLKNLMPVRLSLWLFLFGGLLLAVFVDRLVDRGFNGRLLAVIATIAAGAPLWPAVANRSYALPKTPAFFTSRLVDQLPLGAPVLVAPYPYPTHDVAMLWQAEANLRFSLLGAYQIEPGGTHANFGPPVPLLGQALIGIERTGLPAVSATARQADLASIAKLRLAAVIVGPMAHQRQAVAYLAALFGRQPSLEGGVDFWPLQQSLRDAGHRAVGQSS
jgi:hypothetical protein